MGYTCEHGRHIIVTIVNCGGMLDQLQPVIERVGRAVEVTVVIPEVLVVCIAVNELFIDDGEAVDIETQIPC